MVQEVGYAKLRDRGIDLIAADNPSSFQDDTPTAKLVRQVLGAIAMMSFVLGCRLHLPAGAPPPAPCILQTLCPLTAGPANALYGCVNT
jgi:hypothetical protein